MNKKTWVVITLAVLGFSGLLAGVASARGDESSENPIIACMVEKGYAPEDAMAGDGPTGETRDVEECDDRIIDKSPAPMLSHDLANLTATRGCMGQLGYEMTFKPEPDGRSAVITWGPKDKEQATFDDDYAKCRDEGQMSSDLALRNGS